MFWPQYLFHYAAFGNAAVNNNQAYCQEPSDFLVLSNKVWRNKAFEIFANSTWCHVNASIVYIYYILHIQTGLLSKYICVTLQL